MTRSQCVDLENNYMDWECYKPHKPEPLMFGMSRFWGIPLWNKLVQGFAVSTICHDMELGVSHEEDDWLFATRTKRWGHKYYKWNMRFWSMRKLAIFLIARWRKLHGE